MSAVRSRALVLAEPGTAPVVTEVEVLDPGPGEVRVRLAASGVCGTDSHAVHGTHPTPNLPIVLGHEGAGVVEAVGAGVVDVAVGDHVVCALSVPCGGCRECRRGLPEHCSGEARRLAMQGIMTDGTTRVRRDGAAAFPFFGVGSLSEYSTLRREQVLTIPRDLPLDEFCLTGCGVVTGVGAVLNVARTGVGDVVVVLGCGGVGCNVVQAARAAGATTIVAVDTVAEKLELARKLGATHTLIAGDDLAERFRALEPAGADAVFEVVGSPDLVTTALGMTRVGGTCVMVGIPPFGSHLDLDAFTMTANRRLVGCRGGANVPARDTDRLVALYRAGALDLATLVGRRITLDEAAAAVTDTGGGTVARNVVVF